MPVDDLLVWAADTNRRTSRPPSTNHRLHSPDEPHTPTDLTSPPNNRPPSPSPKRNRLPRWFDVGHCAAACSGRCCLHAAEHRQPDRAVVTAEANNNSSLRGVAEALQTQHRSHRIGFQRNDPQNLRQVSANTITTNNHPTTTTTTAAILSRPKRAKGEYRNPRLELARQALLNGNTAMASAIVADELERLGGV
jgi:hypothetical protein